LEYKLSRLYFKIQVMRITTKNKKAMLNNILNNSRWNIRELSKDKPESKGMFKRLGFLSVLILIIIGGSIFWLLGLRHPKVTDSAKFVAVAKVTRGDLARSVTISGELNPYQEIDLRAKVAGYLKYLTVDIGDQVKVGQVIAKIDTDELKSDYENATAAYTDAKLNYDRLNQVNLKQPGLLAQQDIDNAQAAFEIAKANMDRAHTFMDYATITVPFDGVVTKRYADPGAMIQASGSNDRQTMPVVHIAENDELRLDFPVPEPDVPFIKVGMPMEVTIGATGQKIMGTVARTTNMVDSETRTMETEVDIDNKDLRLTPGMYAYVNLNLEHKKNTLTLPIQAVSFSGNPNVWRINDNDEIQEQPVTIGLQTADKVEIIDGLKEGDQVVFGSREMVNIGMKVKPKLVGENQGS
jgi:RND family efflux transporter MFP subunit